MPTAVDFQGFKRDQDDYANAQGDFLNMSMFAGGTDQDRWERMVNALQYEISLSTSARGRIRQYVGIEVLPGDRILLDAASTINRMMGGIIRGPGRRISEAAGHDGYAQSGYIQASPRFTTASATDPLLKLVDCAGTIFQGLNLRGNSSSDLAGAGIGTQSNSGAGTSNLLFDNCSFSYFNVCAWMGQFTSGSLLDSDCTWRRCDFKDSNAGLYLNHGQSLVHLLDRCAWNNMAVGIYVANGGYLQARMAHTYDVLTFLRIAQIASNGGEVLIDGLRMDGTTYHTQILDIQNTALGYGWYTIRGAKRISGQPNSSTPAIQSRSRAHVSLERSSLGDPSANNVWIGIGAGSDNSDTAIVNVRACDIGTATPAATCGTVLDDAGVVQFRDCYRTNSGGVIPVANSDYAPSAGG